MLVYAAIILGSIWFGILMGYHKARSDLLIFLEQEAAKAVHDQRYSEALTFRRCVTQLRRAGGEP